MILLIVDKGIKEAYLYQSLEDAKADMEYKPRPYAVVEAKVLFESREDFFGVDE